LSENIYPGDILSSLTLSAQHAGEKEKLINLLVGKLLSKVFKMRIGFLPIANVP
jgi:hypothetical protein